jgi:hypothetical protein
MRFRFKFVPAVTISLVLVIAVWLPAIASAQVVIAAEDFDGGALNLLGGFDPGTGNLDGGPGDWYGVANIAAWPQGFPPGVPFSLVDDSFASVSSPGGSPFPADLEGIFGSAADFDNDFFAISDTREWTGSSGETPLVAEWTFDIASAAPGLLQLRIDLGQQSDGNSFGGIAAGYLLVEYSLDGGTFAEAFRCDPVDSTGSGFAFRAMDDGDLPLTVGLLEATSPLPLEKFSAETGLAVTDLFLDKAPSRKQDNPDRLDTFVVDLAGEGSTITIRITTHLPFEALAFDNLEIVATPDFVPGDANGDGALDFGDIEPFVLALLDPEAYAMTYPNVNPDIVLDFDGDGVFTFGDIEGFVDALLG